MKGRKEGKGGKEGGGGRKEGGKEGKKEGRKDGKDGRTEVTLIKSRVETLTWQVANYFRMGI